LTHLNCFYSQEDHWKICYPKCQNYRSNRGE
jgi:hypothetical protein